MIYINSIQIENTEDLYIDQFVDTMLMTFVEDVDVLKSIFNEGNLYSSKNEQVYTDSSLVFDQKRYLHLWNYGLPDSNSFKKYEPNLS